VAHGDAHPGNFFYDPGTRRVTFVDVNTPARLDRLDGPGDRVGRQ
jgi:predicted unusual protein kinase regulating ubiquinone biosynthesis (AarF/ABC1/UbiB family)